MIVAIMIFAIMIVAIMIVAIMSVAIMSVAVSLSSRDGGWLTHVSHPVTRPPPPVA